jgi:hypothetical protein
MPKAPPHRISAASLEAARAILQLYNVTVNPDADVKIPNIAADVRCLALVIDLTSNVFHAAQLRPELAYWQRRMQTGTATATDIVKFLRRVGVELEYLPNYEEHEDEVKLIYADAT